MAQSDCAACGGVGFTFDARCLDEECAHAGKWKLEDDPENPRKQRRVRDRVMPCPPRSCGRCASGRAHAEELRQRARQQRAAVAALGGW